MQFVEWVFVWAEAMNKFVKMAPFRGKTMENNRQTRTQQNNGNFALFRKFISLLFRTLKTITSVKISAKTNDFSQRYDTKRKQNNLYLNNREKRKMC